MTDELILEQVNKNYGPKILMLRDVNLTLAKGTHLSVLGPSGSGKTTLLRIIAGLESIDSGKIFFNGGSLTDIPPYKRNFGYMFQDFALFPHMNVFQNVAFGLKMKKKGDGEIKIQVKKMLELTGLGGYEDRHVNELSGGERQRVALARTLAPSPRLLMLDEPLSSLDRVLRKKLLGELTQIISTLNITTIFVTHDHEEAFAAGNTVLIMKDGRIEQQGTRDDLIQRPANDWVRHFLS
ncbi:MAG: ABC transporter ATP-binding protein [Desulfobacteraceae bacterium]|nr:ABC transporter ATP-binding protein [Desulfobacteraceae bacterium]